MRKGFRIVLILIGLLKNLVFKRSYIVYNIKVVSKVSILINLC